MVSEALATHPLATMARPPERIALAHHRTAHIDAGRCAAPSRGPGARRSVRHAAERRAFDEQMTIRANTAGAAEERCQCVTSDQTARRCARMATVAADIDHASVHSRDFTSGNGGDTNLAAIGAVKGVAVPYLRRRTGEGEASGSEREKNQDLRRSAGRNDAAS